MSMFGRILSGCAVACVLVAGVTVTTFGDVRTTSAAPVSASAISVPAAYGTAVDEGRHRLYVTSYTTPGVLSVFDTRTGALLGSRTTTATPVTVEVNDVTGNVYLAHQGAGNRVSVYSSDLTLLSEFPLLTNPWGPAVNTTTNRFYVANTFGGDVWVVDGATNTFLTTIPLAGTSTLGIAVDEGRNRVYATDRFSNELYVIDGATNTVTSTLPTAATPMWVAIDEPLGKVYVLAQGGTVQVFDANTLTQITSMAVGSQANKIAIDDAHHRAYVSVYGFPSSVQVIDTKTDVVVDSVPVAGGVPYHLAVDESLSKVFVPTANGDQVLVIDDTLPPVSQQLGTDGLADFQASTAGQTFSTIDFDGDGLSDGQTIDAQYAMLGASFSGLSARATTDFTHSPPMGAQASGYNTPGFTGDITIDFASPVASFGLYLNDNEANVRVRVTVEGGDVAALGVPRPAGAGGTLSTFYGFTAPTNAITRIFIDSPGDLFILDDLTLGRFPVVTPPDTTDPAITIVTPVDGSQYSLDEVVTADYSCDDGGGTGIDTCLGTVPAGDPIGTSTLGSHTFTVDAVDLAGNTASQSVTYEVVAAADTTDPTIWIAQPLDGDRYLVDDVAFAGYLCDDGLGSGVDTCVGTVPFGDPIDTSTVGTHTFTVDALDLAGNTASQTVTYEVAAVGDVTPPQVWINRPADGEVFALNQAGVVVNFACDDTLGSGVAQCLGTQPSGSTLDTSSPGGHVFEVTATDNAGNTITESTSYVVSGVAAVDNIAPYISVATPVMNGRYPRGSVHTVSYTCYDFGPQPSGVVSCSGSVANGSLLDTATAGTHAINFVSVDAAGNVGTNLRYYEVIEDGDGDGLSDLWETSGIDIDNDGVIDLPLNLPPYNADPNHRDVFVEMDYMTCTLSPGGCAPGAKTSQAPQPGAVDDVVAAFAAAPLSNPDGTAGVRLHVDVDEAIPQIVDLSFNPVAGADNDYEDIRSGGAGPCNGRFGTPAERALPTCPKLIQAKAMVYRYGLWADSYANAYGSSGIGEYPGNDFMVTTGGQAAYWSGSWPGGLRASEAGTLMHELGHTLGLGHGGTDNSNCKANYLSVMNYSFQVPNYDPTRPLDYSRAALADLFEGALIESAGVGGPSGRNTVFATPAGAPRVRPADGPIDWNNDGDTLDTVARSINDFCSFFGTPGGETLRGADDWSRLQYSFIVVPRLRTGLTVLD